MKLNPDKCVALRCARSLPPYQAVYLINNQPLQAVYQYACLGAKLHSSMRWSHHIQAIVNTATKTLNFVKRTLYQSESHSIFQH